MSAGIRARLDAMQARAEAATEGPWEAVEDYLGLNVRTVEKPATHSTRREEAVHIATGTPTCDVEFERADAEFIAWARQDLPALLAFARDVLDLHTPVTHGPANGWVGAPFTECRECRRSWPCPTVAATHHLGGGSDD